MDDNVANQLRFHNGELTAEVRMLKGMAANANDASTYLLGHLHAREKDLSKEISRLELEVAKILGENLQLKAQLGIARPQVTCGPHATQDRASLLQTKRSSMPTTSPDDSEDYPSENEYKSPIAGRTNKLQLQKTASLVDSFNSLVDLSEHEVLPPTNVVREDVAEPVANIEKPREYGIGLANMRTARPVWEQDPHTGGRTDSLDMSPLKQADMVNDFYIYQRDGTKLLVPMPAFSEHNLNRDAHRNRVISGGCEFTDVEHNRLSGLAMFIEDMDQNALDDYWHKRARTSPRHTAQEWRQYYEQNIRPAYLEKMRVRTDSSGGALTPNSRQEISLSEKTSMSLETKVDASEKLEQVLAESDEVVNGVDETKDEIKDDDEVEFIQDIEVDTPNAVTAVCDEQSSAILAEVTSIAASQVDEHTAQIDHVQAESVISSATEPAPTAQLQTKHSTTVDPPGLNKAELMAVPAQPIRVSTDDKEITSMLESLPKLPVCPQHSRDRISSTFHQVVAGVHPSQANDAHRGGNRNSRFFSNNDSRHAKRDAYPGESGGQDGYRQNGGGRQPRSGRSHQPNSRDDTAPSRETSHNQSGPDTVEDLFAKPTDFDTDPLTFRSVTISVPPSINLFTALSKVRIDGGTLFSATYMETSKLNSKPRSLNNHIMLVFLSGAVAQEFVKRSNSDSIVRHFCKETNTVVVTHAALISTASRPVCAQIEREIHDLSLSRVLWIRCPDGVRSRGNVFVRLTPEAAWRALLDGRSGKPKVPLHASEDDEGVIRLEYASLNEAKTAWDMLLKLGHYFGSADYGFAPDPCGSTVSKEESLAWRAEISEDIISEQDQLSVHIVSAQDDLKEPNDPPQTGKVMMPSVEVQFAHVYDFQANAVRERQIAELRASMYLTDMARDLIKNGRDAGHVVLDGTSKETGKLAGGAVKDAKSSKREARSWGSKDGQKHSMSDAQAAVKRRNEVREMEYVAREREG